MPQVEKTPIEACARFTRFFTTPRGIREKDLGCDCKYRRIRKGTQQRFEESAIHNHIVIQKNNDARAGMIHTTIVASRKTVISIQRENADTRKILLNKLRAAIGTAVVDNEDFVRAAVISYGFDYGRE